MAVNFDLNRNYTAELQDAVAKGDYSKAASLEQEMNAKIDYLNETGTNQWNAQQSNKYSQYLNTGPSSGTGGGQYVAADPTGVDNYHAKNTANQGLGMSASDLKLLESYGANWNAATSEEDKAYWHEQAEKLRESYGYFGGDDGSEYIPIAKQPVVSTPGFTYSEEAPTHTDPYSARIDEMLNQILNRDKFSYDAAADPLFAQYKDQYAREGQRAMQDTLGQVAARTGGMASSYAVSAAQQQNNYYMQQLSDKVPELYQLAYQMYLDDIDLQVQDLGLLEGASDRQYNRFRDTMADWRDDRDFAYGQYRDDVADGQWQSSFDRGVFESDRDYDYGVGRDEINDGRYNEEQAYQKEQDANSTAYERAMELLYAGVMPESSMLSAAGLTATQANSLLEAAKAASNVTASNSETYKPKLSASAVVDALENGIVNDEMRQAYKYYYGQDWVGEDDGGGDELTTEERERLFASIDKLNIGPVDPSFVQELRDYGGVVEKDGTVSWANGWNEKNYEQKLEDAKKLDKMLNGELVIPGLTLPSLY